MQKKVHVNSFIRRQTASSQFSHYDGEWEDLQKEVELLLFELSDHKNILSSFYVRKGYRDGVILVDVSTHGHFSGVAKLTEGDILVGSYKARREGETPRKSVSTVFAKKLPAVSTFVVLYASTVLAEDGDNELPAEEGNWEMISLNSNPYEGEEMPIAPEVLMANYFHDDGGTDTQMSPREFVEQLRISREWWADKAMVYDGPPIPFVLSPIL